MRLSVRAARRSAGGRSAQPIQSTPPLGKPVCSEAARGMLTSGCMLQRSTGQMLSMALRGHMAGLDVWQNIDEHVWGACLLHCHEKDAWVVHALKRRDLPDIYRSLLDLLLNRLPRLGRREAEALAVTAYVKTEPLPARALILPVSDLTTAEPMYALQVLAQA